MNGLIVLTVFLVVGSGELKRSVTKSATPVFRPILAGFIVGVFLFIFAALNSGVAQKACYLLIAFALIVNGAGIAATLGNVTKVSLASKVSPTVQSPATSAAGNNGGGGGR